MVNKIGKQFLFIGKVLMRRDFLRPKKSPHSAGLDVAFYALEDLEFAGSAIDFLINGLNCLCF